MESAEATNYPSNNNNIIGVRRIYPVRIDAIHQQPDHALYCECAKMAEDLGLPQRKIKKSDALKSKINMLKNELDRMITSSSSSDQSNDNLPSILYLFKDEMSSDTSSSSMMLPPIYLDGYLEEESASAAAAAADESNNDSDDYDDYDVDEGSSRIRSSSSSSDNEATMESFKKLMTNRVTVPSVSLRNVSTATLNRFVDLSRLFPPCFDQGSLGSCVAQSYVAVVSYLYKVRGRRNAPHFLGSALFLYYNSRALRKSTNVDSGAYLVDGIRAMVKWGVSSDACWRYRISKFKQRAPNRCYREAKRRVCRGYANMYNKNLQVLKQNLLSGLPIVVGIAIFDPFESAQVATTGIVPMPKPSDRFLGGHAVVIVGFSDDFNTSGRERGVTGYFLVRNSWGTRWGVQGGHFWIPYEYVLSNYYTSEMWIVSAMS